MPNMNIIDPNKIKEEDLPLVCLVDDRRSFLSWIIKAHTSGNYNHIMEYHRGGYFASQSYRGFREIKIGKYMKSHLFLKFWKVKNLTQDQKEKWESLIRAELRRPWWDRRYDYLGVVGQFLKIRWLNNPWLKYCSERVAEHLRKALGKIVKSHPTPSELDRDFKLQDNMELYGYWMSDV